MCISAQKLGCEEAAIGSIRAVAQGAMEPAQSAATAAEVFLSQAAKLIAEVQRLHAGKHEKIAWRARQMIEWNIEHRTAEESLSLKSVAAALKVSPAHLSRVFRQVVGMPFQNFVIARRIDLAKRLLLDPLYSVAQVAEACGYANPAYFAKLFRRTTGRLPRDYVKNPMRPHT
jgi:AraC-like DNA-binding protein